MSVHLKLHGPFYTLSDDGILTLSLKTPFNLIQVRQALLSLLKINDPSLIPLLQSCRFACNDELIIDEHEMLTASSIIIIPPVSGG